ncbi:programmed cell death protein 2-like isoform X2 [Moschus berezovskii]|uniref:programmed cell death protein 2-like isoform X2 n=1 Tax=Moschus berezovskii TaxID=68408 RepID=UPI0024452C36|nr:programmed cell death protein 2-like isoform X2 [Moschus berezovskii]
MASPSAALAELGFVEAAPSWRLRSEQFPSKVGGRPAWLSAAGLPGPPELACPLCGRPMAFLLQVYAPLSGRADAFHRCLFLFCCRTPPCCCGLRVFRNQLPRRNDFYSYEPPSEDPPSETGESVYLQLKSGAQLCRVCGCSGPKRCSRCHKAHYCSKEHQSLDWRLGHKQACAQTDNLDNTVPDHDFLFPEFEIVIETEDEIMPEVVERDDESETIGSMDEAHEEELESMAKHESREDRIFQKFKNKISLEPEQVMPQLLNHLKADRRGRSVDWGVLAIFTCAESCELGIGYTEEFVWKQDVTDAA